MKTNRGRLALVVALAVVGVNSWRLIASWDWLSTYFWDWLRAEAGGVESGSTTVRNLGLVIAGLIALPLAVWRSWVAQRQSDTAQHNLLNERYQQGAEMIGSEVLPVRLGGIYALQRLALEYPKQYHIQIMQLLCAFVRHPPAGVRDKTTRLSGEPNRRELRSDVHEAIASISVCHARQGRLEEAAGFRLDLRGANLSGADLFKAGLSRANLAAADLTGAKLIGADLAGALLSRANLAGASLSGADLGRAVLERAELSGARLDSANLAKAGLAGAILFKARLSNANLAKAHLSNANLAGAFLHESDLSRTRLQGSTLAGAQLPQADLTGASLSRTNLSRALLSGANLLDSQLSEADLSDASLGPLTIETHEVNEDPYRQTIRTKVTQTQLDDACADPENPPTLDGAFDADTGEPLVWRGKPLEGQT